MAKNENLTLNIYDNKGKVVKTVDAQLVQLKFKTVRTIMEILNIESVDNTVDILKTLYAAWDEIKEILVEIFPDATLEELDNTNLNELLPLVVSIVKYSFAEVLTIPTNSKN